MAITTVVIIAVVVLVALLKKDWMRLHLKLFGAHIELEARSKNEARANVGPSSPK